MLLNCRLMKVAPADAPHIQIRCMSDTKDADETATDERWGAQMMRVK